MGQNDASTGLQPRSISALEVQGGDGVVSDLFDGNTAEGLEVGLVHNGNEELGSVCICEVVAADINLFDTQIKSHGGARSNEQQHTQPGV